jgi:nucleoside triphosphatase
MEDKKYPEPTVGALIFNKENKVFLMTSPKWKGKYVIPGGHIELGETIEQALKREIKEETNLNIYDIRFVMMQEFVFGKEFHKKKHFIFLDYFCKTEGNEVVLNEEGTDYVWVDIDEALNLPIEPYTRNLILEYKNRFNKNNNIKN